MKSCYLVVSVIFEVCFQWLLVININNPLRNSAQQAKKRASVRAPPRALNYSQKLAGPKTKHRNVFATPSLCVVSR